MGGGFTISSNLSIVISAKDLSSKVMGDIGKSGDSLGGRIAGLGKVMATGLAMGTAALVGIGVSSAKAAADAEGIATATNAVLASTKGVAGMTADAVADLATQLSRVTPFDDEVIQSGQNLLLTFTNIGKDVFPKATETALNMSQALGQDVSASAIQLGKALNDPIAGVTALRKVGVQLSDAQEELIGKFMAVGDIAGAQRVILGELETEFGGAAVAAGQTLAGQLAILQTGLGNVQETIGAALLPAITPLVTAFASSLPGAMETLKPALASVGEMVKKLASGDFQGAFTDMMGICQDVGGQLATTLVDWGKQLWSWVEPMIGPMQAKLWELLGKLYGWIGEQVQPLLTKLGEWGEQLWSWVEPMISPMLDKAGQLAGDLLTWIGDQVQPLLTKLGEWGRELWAWVEPMIPPLLVEAGKLAGQLLDWIGAEGPGLAATFIREWVPNAIAWVAQAAIDIVPKLFELAGNIVNWIITEGGPKLFTAAINMGRELIGGVMDGAGQLASSLYNKLMDLLSFDFGWVKLSARSGVSFNIPTPQITMPSFGDSGGNAASDARARESAWVAGGSVDFNAITGEMGYALGGLVSGPIGAPQRAIVHGGELVLTPAQQRGGGGVTVVVNNPTFLSGDRLAAREFARLLQGELAALPAMRQL